MLKQSILENIRTPIKFVFLILLFFTSFIILCFSLNYYNFIQTNLKGIDKIYTTIAVPDIQAIDNSLPDPNQRETGFRKYYEAESDFYITLRHFVESSENGFLDNSEILRGVCNNVTPVLSGAFDPLEYNSEADLPCNAAAFIVTVMDVEYYSQNVLDKRIVNSGGGTDESAHYVVRFRIDESILLNPCYQAPEYIYISSGAFSQDLQSPFVYGKQYFISGEYYGVKIIQKERNNGTPIPDMYLDYDETSVPCLCLDGSDFIIFPNVIGDRETPIIKDINLNGETTKANTYSDKELSHMCIPYEGDLDKLLAERPDISERLDNALINSNSIYVRSTNNLNSILYFNQGKALIMAGRDFSEKEINSGASVCIVNERFATYNNLKIGDLINVKLYNALMRETNNGVWLMSPYHSWLSPQLHIKEVNRGELELKIVGIYITQPWDYTAYSINYNTIFIPSNTVPIKLNSILHDKEELEGIDKTIYIYYSSHKIPSLFTVIIPNDKLNEFQAETSEAGFGEYFIYNDQGFGLIKDTFPLVKNSTQALIIVAFAEFCAVYALYLVLLTRKRYSLGMLITLGAKRKDAIFTIVWGWLIIILPAIILCFITILFTGEALVKSVLDSTIEQLHFDDSFSAGAQDIAIKLTSGFNRWTNINVSTGLILLGIFSLYFISSLVVNILLSKQSVLKLLRRG